LGFTALLPNADKNAGSNTRTPSSKTGPSTLLDIRATTPNMEAPQADCIPSEGHGIAVPATYNDIINNLSTSAKSCIKGAWAQSTQKRYGNRIILWKKWCAENNLDFKSAGVASVLNYLSTVQTSNVSFSVINMTKCAIASVHELIEGRPVGTHPLVSKFMKGAHKARPPKPKYTSTWDVNKVLDVLGSDKFNPDSSIGLRNLKHKTVFLIMLSTACRQSVITRLARTTDQLIDRGDHFLLHPSGWDKTSRFTNKVHDLLIFKNNQNVRVSPYHSLETYLKRSHKSNKIDLFRSDLKGKPLKVKEVASWVVNIMAKANISAEFSSHSIRGAAASRALSRLGASDIMEAVDWKAESTFRKFYLRNVEDSRVEKRRAFQNSILRKN